MQSLGSAFLHQMNCQNGDDRMLMRLWHGRVWAGRLTDFLALLSSRAVREYPQTAGYQGVYAFQRRKGGEVEVLLASFWNSAESLQNFADADRERAAHHNPEHRDMLIDPAPSAEHFKLVHLHLNPAAPKMGPYAGRPGLGFIMRQWRGRVPSEKAADYLEFLKISGFADYAATPGNLGVYGLQKDSGGITEFVLITLWESFAAIRKFAGEDYEKAHYYPQDQDFLLEVEPLVGHSEVALASPADGQTPGSRVIL
jgi:heme-degrading monooxygenase HmoA